MANPEFHYQPMFDLGPDKTEYYLLTKDYVSVSEFEGKPILKIEKEGLTAMANAAFRDVSFLLRRAHNEQVAKILSDPEASDNDKYVALTFDDGPHASLTPRALDILNRHGAKGTFFMLGQNASRNKSIVARAAAEGHELGVHTWSHIKMNSSSRAKVDNEVSRTQKVLAEASGVTPRVMRPPYGATNKTLVNHMHDHYGMASILWDVDTLDWRKPGVSKVINTAVSEAKPGSIILVHDIHASTLDALEGIVTGLQARGFKLVTVSELMQIGKREAAEAAAAAAAPVVEPQPVEPAQTETPAALEPAGQPAAPELETPAESSAEAEQPLQLEQLILN